MLTAIKRAVMCNKHIKNVEKYKKEMKYVKNWNAYSKPMDKSSQDSRKSVKRLEVNLDLIFAGEKKRERGRLLHPVNAYSKNFDEPDLTFFFNKEK